MEEKDGLTVYQTGCTDSHVTEHESTISVHEGERFPPPYGRHMNADRATPEDNAHAMPEIQCGRHAELVSDKRSLRIPTVVCTHRRHRYLLKGIPENRTLFLSCFFSGPLLGLLHDASLFNVPLGNEVAVVKIWCRFFCSDIFPEFVIGAFRLTTQEMRGSRLIYLRF